MGEAKRRAAIGMMSFHMTKREQLCVMGHIVNKASANREERRKRRHLWRELGLIDAVAKFVEIAGPEPAEGETRQPIGLDTSQWADNLTPYPVQLSGPSIDFLLQQIDGQLPGPLSEILAELEDRLQDVKAGKYDPPDELVTEEEPTSSPPLVPPAPAALLAE